ncbi:MAG: NAD(+) synthase [Clostridia bacterium]|nr:NAD(+) synthase [Clostridia bacterium]
MFKDYLRMAVCAPRVHIGNAAENCREITELYEKMHDKADILLLPELCLCGYTCQDLFQNSGLIRNVNKALEDLRILTAKYGESGALLTVGLPFYKDGELYNCAALLHNGKILAVIPKTFLPNHGEFYEKRWFTAGPYEAEEVTLHTGQTTVFGNNLLIDVISADERVTIGVELCEDAWVPVSPGRICALSGAELIMNLSASNEITGKAQYRRELLGGISASCVCAYAYASAGRYESTSDTVFGGHCLIYENGRMLGELAPFEEGILVRDISLSALRYDRMHISDFSDCKNIWCRTRYKRITCNKVFLQKDDLKCSVSMTPFIPRDNLLSHCLDIFNIQVAGLMRRIEATHCRCITVGVSGGLDSTLALMVAAQAIRNLNLPTETLQGITMPGFGTTSRTKNNSVRLMEVLGCGMRTVDITASTRQHFTDIGHDENIHDTTYENAQARERTQILMDIANKEGGFVLGTGDLSELALGWCTYNGDHMSMYGVNVGIPKTLVRTLVDMVGHYLAEKDFAGLDEVVEDILDTPVSPELLPPNPDGTIAQKTEDNIGSYVLHDFFLYHTLRFGLSPMQIFDLCKCAVRQSDVYNFSDDEIKKWLRIFCTRFYRQQFKRNCMPDGVKVGMVSLSPRADLRLPSEIEFDELISELM